MINDAGRIYDGYFSLEGGVDGGRQPNLIGKNQAQSFSNGIFREGGPTTRPPFTMPGEDFENPNLVYSMDGTFLSDDSSLQNSLNNFHNGNVQGALYYAPSAGHEYICAMIAGRLYRITPGETSLGIREIGLARRNRSTLPISWMIQADTYLIVQDGENAPIIFDGSVARRAVAGEIFVGTIMGYGLDRIVLIGKDGLVYFGDIRNGKGNGGVDVLGFTETTFLNEGFPSALPAAMGLPTAITFLPQQDASTGIGDCLIFGESGAEAFTLSIPREMWKDSQFQREALRKIGCTGHRQIAEINNDIWFRSSDGWRSYRQARAEVDKYAQLPESTNVKRWTESDTEELLKYGSAMSFDNRLVATCTPQPNENRPFHNGLLSLDFDVLSTFGEAIGPAWDGHWGNHNDDPLIGLKVTQLVEGKFNGRHRAFIFTINLQGQNSILELQKLPQGRDSAGAITSVLITRAMDNDAPDNEKQNYGGDLWVDGVTDPDDVVVIAKFRPDSAQDWQPWHSFTVKPEGTAGHLTLGGVPTLKPGFAPRKSLKKPPNTTDSQTLRINRRGYEFQARIQWTGRATMRRFRMQMQQPTERAKALVSTTQP